MSNTLENYDIDQVILASLEGHATANEIEILRNWISESEENKQVYELTKQYWTHSQLTVVTPDVDKAYQKLISGDIEKSEKPTHKISIAPKKTDFSWIRIAAALTFLLGLAFAVYFVINDQRSHEEVLVSQQIFKENPKGQKLTTYLPDGSKVILNSQSSIRYLDVSKDQERRVVLNGEAFFEVKKDAKRPFVVEANGVETSAIGTSFNVNSKYKDQVEIVLVTGKVNVSNELGVSVMLDPGKGATVSKEGAVEVFDFSYLDKVGWKDGILAFNDDTLPEIIRKLEDWYGVEFIADAAIGKDFHYTGNYENESLEEVLFGISFVHQFNFKITGDTVRIYLDQKSNTPM